MSKTLTRQGEARDLIPKHHRCYHLVDRTMLIKTKLNFIDLGTWQQRQEQFQCPTSPASRFYTEKAGPVDTKPERWRRATSHFYSSVSLLESPCYILLFFTELCALLVNNHNVITNSPPNTIERNTRINRKFASSS